MEVFYLVFDSEVFTSVATGNLKCKLYFVLEQMRL